MADSTPSSFHSSLSGSRSANNIRVPVFHDESKLRFTAAFSRQLESLLHSTLGYNTGCPQLPVDSAKGAFFYESQMHGWKILHSSRNGFAIAKFEAGWQLSAIP